MANRTLRGSLNVHGTNPQFLVEKTIRSRIYDSRFWKEHCFALTAESIIDRAVDLEYVGGTYGLQRPSPFLCLLQKLLQLQPEREIILEYLNAAEFKYLRALAAMYVRLTFRAVEVYELLEPLLDDYRKLRWRDMTGTYSLTYMDVFVDQLLTQERVCDIILPRLTRRDVLEEIEGLAPRTSKLEDVLLHGKAALSNGAGGVDGRDDADGSGAESDDSAAETRRERRLRAQRAARIRELRLQQERDGGGEGALEEGEEIEYASQELSDDEEAGAARESKIHQQEPVEVKIEVTLEIAAWGRPPEADDGGYVSRSPSRSPDRE
ncbi:related to PRP38A - pre-mRNA-splicing factor [Pseudozyma flocculosa]|uniref:Pre-mRNA-splicing factor 38 n=1 Tax=Pseudozyma flocculosa TaxID=84751 RepID=A0A5C3EXA6_9BASI|nr:related to PRP38A - pre-mRNA-splicing factor [Pseudozyma flocculosa]